MYIIYSGLSRHGLSNTVLLTSPKPWGFRAVINATSIKDYVLSLEFADSKFLSNFKFGFSFFLSFVGRDANMLVGAIFKFSCIF